MDHLLSCRLLEEACTADDLAIVTERAQGMRPQVGNNCVKDTKEEEERDYSGRVATAMEGRTTMTVHQLTLIGSSLEGLQPNVE